MNAEERETTICACDADATVHIWSAQRRYITRMRKDPAFTEVASGVFEGTEWAEFSVPADRWSPAGVKRTRKMSENQKEQARSRLSTHNRGEAS